MPALQEHVGDTQVLQPCRHGRHPAALGDGGHAQEHGRFRQVRRDDRGLRQELVAKGANGGLGAGACRRISPP
jgi:hypothetical protein